MLDKIVTEKWRTAKAVFGLWPAHSIGDDSDVVVLLPSEKEGRKQGMENRRKASHRRTSNPPDSACPFPHFLRQQGQAGPNARTSARRFHRAEGIRQAGIDRRSRSPPGWASSSTSRASEADHDDYNAILLRPSPTASQKRSPNASTSACAPSSGAADEAPDAGAGSRRNTAVSAPRPATLACPEHSEKATLFDMFDAPGNAGIVHHRPLRDAAGRVGVGLVFQPSAQPVPRGRACSVGTGSRILRAAQKTSASRRRWNAGWRRTRLRPGDRRPGRAAIAVAREIRKQAVLPQPLR